MKITASGLEFFEFREFKKFATEYELFGLVSLSEPIIDKSGNVLLKEKVAIKDTVIRKLDQMEGQYIPTFKLLMTSDLLKRLKGVLAKAVISRIEDRTNVFVHHLYEQSSNKMASLKGIIQNSFYSKSLVLAFFKVLLTMPEFFNHITNMGLLSLGAVVQKNFQYKMVNRLAFLTGLFADLSGSHNDLYKECFYGQGLNQLTALSSELARKFNLAEEIIAAINSHPISAFEIPGTKPADFKLEEVRKSFLNLDLMNSVSLDDESLEEEEVEGQYSEDTAEVVLEAMKIARYISENLKATQDKDHVSEKLLVMFTYNSEKGLFRKDMADPMISRFQEFDQVVKKIRVVAEIENKCKFPPSAWAYPKPKAAQILCKNKNYACPLIVNGWDLKIITTQDPFGFIGTALNVGTYPKCSLEEELQAKFRYE